MPQQSEMGGKLPFAATATHSNTSSRRGRSLLIDATDADLSPKFPPALHGVLGVKSVTLGGHFVHVLSLQEFHRRQVA